MALVGTEVVNIIEPNSTNIILGPIWIDLVTQTWRNTYLKNWQILGWTPYFWGFLGVNKREGLYARGRFCTWCTSQGVGVSMGFLWGSCDTKMS